MPNETLRASQAHIDAMFANEEVPTELIGDITLSDLAELVQDLVSGAIREFADREVPEDSSEEAMREMIEQVALKVGLICMNLVPQDGSTGDIEVALDPDDVTAVFAQLMRSGGATLRIRVN